MKITEGTYTRYRDLLPKNKTTNIQ